MKKLMIMMAAIATGAMTWAASLAQQVTYTVPTDAEVGPTNIVGYTDDFQKQYTDTSAFVHWWMDGFVIGETEDPLTVAVATVDETEKKVLQLESGSESPVLRTFNRVTSDGCDPVDIDDHGTFVDTWVKLSASEGDLEAQEDDKIAVWLQVVEEETDDQGAVTVPAATNLVVTCGALNSLFEPTKTNVVLDANIVPDTWHRITIRAMKGIATGVNNIGFLVYIDENIVSAKSGYQTDLADLLTGDAKTYAQNCQLFPSLQQDAAATLTAAGFAGVGQIASVNLDTQHSAPAFAKDKTYVAITWDENVTSVVLGDGANMVTTPGVAGTNVIEIVDFSLAGYTSPEQTLKITYANTFKCDDITGSANLASFSKNETGTVVEFALAEYESGQIDITSIIDRIEAVVTVDGGEEQPFTTLEAAFGYINALESGAVEIKLGEDIAALAGYNYFSDTAADSITIDLNGKTLQLTGTTPGDEDEAYIVGTCPILITDNSELGGGKIVAALNAIEGDEDFVFPIIKNKVPSAAGALTLDDVAGADIEYVGWIVNNYTGIRSYTIDVLGGKFSQCIYTTDYYDPMSTHEHATDGITLGTQANPLCWLEPETEEDYWTLIPKVAFTLVKPNHTTVQSIVDENGASVAESDKIDPNATYIVTLKADSGYVWKGETKDTDETEEEFVFNEDADVDGKITLTTSAPVEAEAETVSYEITADETATLVIMNDGTQTTALKGVVVVGKTLTITATAADGYEYDGSEDFDKDVWAWNSANSTWTFTKTAEKDAPITATVESAKAITYVAQVGDTKYRTLAGAIEAAAADQTVTLLTGITLTETLTIAKPTAINLAGYTVTFGDGLKNGIVTTADAGNLVISNGHFAVAGTRPNGGLAFQLYRVNATIKDVEMDLTGFEYGLEAETMLDPMVNNWTEQLLYTITCENVDVTGNGSLFHFENVIATLDADCSATLKAGSTPFGAAHNAAIYSSCGAKVTVAGGNYNYSQQVALQTGDLGGTLIVNGGTFTGDIKSYMGQREKPSKDEWEANIGTITITGGTFDGNFVEEVPGSEKTVWNIKGGTFSADPTKYLAANYATIKNADDKWDVGLAIIATFMVDSKIYTAQTNITAFTPATPTAPEKPNYTFTGWNPEIGEINESKTYMAQFSAKPATLTLPETATGVATMKVYESDDGKATWKPVTIDDGAYPIAAGNFYKVEVTAETGYDLVGDGAITSDAAVTAGQTIMIEAAQLEALVKLHNFTITYMNDDKTLDLSPATFTIADAVTLPNDLGAQVGGTFKGWYTDSAFTVGTEITGWAAGEQTDDVTVYAKIEQVTDDVADIINDKVEMPTDATDAQKKAIHDNTQLIYTKFGTKELAEAWIADIYGESAKIDGAKLAAASAENVEIAMKYDIEIMVNPVIKFNATVAATEGNVAAFTFQIKDGDEGKAISLAKAKVLSMVQYCSTLGSWTPATDTNVGVSVDGTTAKVQLKQTAAAAGFMKVVLTPPAK